MKRKIAVFILVFVLAAHAALIPAAAADFPDLEHHWAKEYMEDLAQRGYLTGYEDGTMRPNNTITAVELFALLSRLYSPDPDTAQLIADDYADLLAEIVPENYNWAVDELAICLAAGIVESDELSASVLSRPLSKELFSVYTAKAIQLDTDLPEDYDTGLTDMDKVTEEYLPYVCALVNKGIITGNEYQEFEPDFRVTRAVAATIISRALDVAAEAGELEIPGYYDLETMRGVVTSITDNTLYLRGLDGILMAYTAYESAENEGCLADLWIRDGYVVRAVYGGRDWIQGKISSNRTTSTKSYIGVDVNGEGNVSNYTINENSKLRNGTEAVTQSQLKTNYFVTFRAFDDTVIELYTVSGPITVEGYISELSYGTTVAFSIANGGMQYIIPLNMASLPAIKLGELDISLDQLNIGDRVSVEIENGDVKTITAQQTESIVKGELYSTITDASGIRWQIRTAAGALRELMIDKNTKITKNGKTIALTDVNIGDDISATIYGDTVAKIEVDKAKETSSLSKLSGTVLAVDSTKKLITILEGGNLYYIDASSVSLIVDAAAGRSLRLSGIEPDSLVVAYGSYSSMSTLEAVTIVIEG